MLSDNIYTDKIIFSSDFLRVKIEEDILHRSVLLQSKRKLFWKFNYWRTIKKATLRVNDYSQCLVVSEQVEKEYIQLAKQLSK